MRRRGRYCGQRFVSCRKRRLDTGTRDSDEADDSSHRRRLRKGGRGCRKTIHTCSSLSLKWGIMGAGHRVARRCSNSFNQGSRSYRVEAQSLWASQSRDFGRLKATGAIIFRTDQDGQIRLRFTPRKSRNHNDTLRNGRIETIDKDSLFKIN